jgi:hypothetical protein
LRRALVAGALENSCAASDDAERDERDPGSWRERERRWKLRRLRHLDPVSSVSAAGAVLASAYVPMSFPEAVQFFRTEPARAGYRAFGAKESEGAGRAGGEFRARGRTGRWTIDELPGCTTAVVITLRFRPLRTPPAQRSCSALHRSH